MTRPDRILLAQTSFLGDVVLTTALAQAVRAARPEADLYWLVRPEAAPLLVPIAGAERVLVFDKRGSDAGWSGLLATAKRLRALRFAVAIGVPRWLAPPFCSRSRAFRIGFAGSPGSPLYHQRVRRRGAHARDRLLSLAAPLGGTSGPPRTPALSIDEGAAQALEAELRAAGVAPGERLLVLAPGSAWATKRWPAVRFAEAAESLLRAARVPVEADPAGARAPRVAEIAARLPASRVVDLTGRTDTAEWSRRCAGDLVSRTAARACRRRPEKPVAAVFGPTVPEQGSPRRACGWSAGA
jgi:heptosyltransferase-2